MRDALHLLDRFIKDTTHELNTPVTAIITNIEMIDKSLLDEKLAKKINRIEIGAKTISNIYEDLTFVTLNNQIISNNENINYNRKVKFIGISSLKQEVEHIARKYDIAVSTVQASYTSKMCPICGCIEDENRPNQETFECIECGYKDNADFNAAKNIRNRVLVTVLRESLLKQLGNGAFEPKKLKREKVKEVLLSFRRTLQETARSECTNCSVTTFDYV